MIPLIVLLIAYLLGAIPFGFLLAKWKTGDDVRTTGSGNIGATNVMRTSGRTAGIATLLLDIGKGYLAVWIAGRLTGGPDGPDTLWMSAAALAVMAGHAYPVFLGFRGGKAVACMVGAFLCLTPGAIAAEAIVFVGVVAWTRHISMGSIVGAATLPLAIWLILKGPLAEVLASILAGAFVIYRHSNNIRRLRMGTENVFSFGARKS
jgi:acyl phosphate:glycerol-3-phosphate acyltransferase